MAVKGGACRIQPARQPSGGYGAGGLVNQRRVVAFDDAVVVGQKEKRFGIGLLAGGNGRTDGTDIVAQVGMPVVVTPVRTRCWGLLIRKPLYILINQNKMMAKHGFQAA